MYTFLHFYLSLNSWSEIPRHNKTNDAQSRKDSKVTNLFRVIKYEGVTVCLRVDTLGIFSSECKETVFRFRDRVGYSRESVRH